MTRKLKLLDSKEIRLKFKYDLYYLLQPTPPQLTHCGHIIVETITMNIRKATEDLSSLSPSKPNTSKDYVYYMAGRQGAKLDRVALTKVGKQSS